MALVPALINVTWNANYNGPHRVCWREGSSGPYTCTQAAPTLPTHPNCAGSGLACGYDIDIMVDNETCDTVTYEGYVQPACEDEASLVGRIPFSVNFVPSPSCKQYNVACVESDVDSITIINGGSGYSSPPTVSIVGGGGLGATATATLTGGVVTSITVVSPGSNYTAVPAVIIDPPTSGVTASATAVMSNCPSITYEDCIDSGAHAITNGLAFLTNVTMCSSDGTPGVPAGYSIEENVGQTCLCDCVEMEITNTGLVGDVIITYIQCQDSIDSQQTTIAAGGTSGTICVVTGSLTFTTTGDGTYNETIGAACNAAP